MKPKIKVILVLMLFLPLLSLTPSAGNHSNNQKNEDIHKKAIIFEWKGDAVLTIIYQTHE